MTIRCKGLQDKWKRDIAERGVGENLFNRRPEMHAHSGIPAVQLGDHGSDGVFVIVGNCRNYVMVGVDGAGQRQHEWSKNDGLQSFGAAEELRKS